ncbi:unnamed protein product [Callosobruchus maculatus]|uniref:EF-hand domain-containing protein n=1 Tax=Callosobruchus maculatus TaxID=64391 RepID=A0A653DQ90_CALMS|nr:unnamed protein product [Callosobruchus maculatus]
MSADQELNQVLIRRQEINDALENGHEVKIKYRVINVYHEFQEFTKKEIKSYEATFKKFNTAKDGFLSLPELKRMMEQLGAPQTHIGLKGMIKEVDADGDGRLCFAEFMMVFRKARAGELEENSGLDQLAKLTEVNITELAKKSKFEEELRQEQEERKREEEERAIRRQQFLEKAAVFKLNA